AHEQVHVRGAHPRVAERVLARLRHRANGGAKHFGSVHADPVRLRGDGRGRCRLFAPAGGDLDERGGPAVGAEAHVEQPGLVVATTTRSSSTGVTPATSNARRPARTANVEVVSPGAAMRRSRIPVRRVIHSSSRPWDAASSALVTTCSGAASPQPVIAAYDT